MKRIIAILMVLVVSLSVCACAKQPVVMEENETETEQINLEPSDKIVTVNGRTVTIAEFKYYLAVVKQQMLYESGTTDAENFWDTEIDGLKASEAAKKQALEEILRIETACIKAEEKGISVSSEELKNIRDYVNSKDDAVKAEIDSVLELTDLSREQLIDLLTKITLANMYVSNLSAADSDSAEFVPTEAEIQAAYEKEYVHVKHILISNGDTPAAGEEAKDSDTLKAEHLKLAKEVLQKAKAGVNFDSLVQEYGEDPGMEQSPDGYTFTKGTMVAPFETASFELKIGAISDLVETDYGWHIIKRLPLPTSGEDYEVAVATVEQELTVDKQQALIDKYNAVLDSYKSEMDIVIHQKVVDAIEVVE